MGALFGVLMISMVVFLVLHVDVSHVKLVDHWSGSVVLVVGVGAVAIIK